RSRPATRSNNCASSTVADGMFTGFASAPIGRPALEPGGPEVLQKAWLITAGMGSGKSRHIHNGPALSQDACILSMRERRVGTRLAPAASPSPPSHGGEGRGQEGLP